MRMIRAGLVLVLGGIATAGQKPTPTERPPGVVLGYNKDASGSIQGVCRSAEKGTVECNFTEVIFFPPYTANTRSEEQKIIEDLRKDPDAMKDRMATMAKETRDMMEKARGVMMGPKGRQEIDDLIKAAESGDPERVARALMDRERRTCHMLVYNYTPKFHRIGVRKWLSDQVPEGLCHTVQVWELSSDDEQSVIWKIRSTTVAVGNTSGLCEPMAKAVKEVTEWNMQNPKEYEPPCDFIAYFQ